MPSSQPPLFDDGESRVASQVPPHPLLPQYYANAGERRWRVQHLFDASAPHYDWITQLMSMGTGAAYRQRALRRGGLAPGMHVLDVGCGTGVLAELAAALVGSQGRVIGLDPSQGMLHEASRCRVSCAVQAMGEHLPFAEHCFDMLTMGYALRHVADLHLAFREYARVLRPGGILLLLEVTRPASRLFSWLLQGYFQGVIAALTWLCRRSREAQMLVSYYWDTIAHCVPPETILATLEQAGFAQVQRHVEVGIFSAYTARKT